MSEKTCKKCGSTATYSGAEPQSCPACGAVYAKVEAALAERSKMATSKPTHATMRVSAQKAAPSLHGDCRIDVHAFAAHMRAESLYPTWRKLVSFLAFVGYFLAGVTLIGAIVAAKRRLS